MRLQVRDVDLVRDRDFVLSLKVLTNYNSDSPLAREEPFAAYRERWYASGQPEEFWAEVGDSLADPRTLALVFDLEDQQAGWTWVTFRDVEDYDVTAAELRELAVAPEWQRRGAGREIVRHVELAAASRGATVLRSEAGIANRASLALHAVSGFRPSAVLFEKELAAERAGNERAWRQAAATSVMALAPLLDDSSDRTNLGPLPS